MRQPTPIGVRMVCHASLTCALLSVALIGRAEGQTTALTRPDERVAADAANATSTRTAEQTGGNFNIAGNGVIDGSLGVGTSAPVAKLQVHTTALDQHVYLSSAAPSLALGNSDTRSVATMNGLFALSTAAGHYGVEPGGLMIANYGDARGNIYVNSNYAGNGSTNVILQPLTGNVGIGTSDPFEKLQVVGDLRVDGHVFATSSGNTISGKSTSFIGVLGESTSNSGIGVYGKTPDSASAYAGYFHGNLRATGIVTIDNYSDGGGASVCRNAFLEISLCSSSLRYKTDVEPFAAGFDLIKRLRPITFTWKQDGTQDIGFGAEEVEQIEPLLVTYNPKGEVEGVKYDRLTAVLVNAAREQQTQLNQQQALITQQRQQLDTQQQEIDALKQRQPAFEALKRLVCAEHHDADVCQSNR